MLAEVFMAAAAKFAGRSGFVVQMYVPGTKFCIATIVLLERKL